MAPLPDTGLVAAGASVDQILPQLYRGGLGAGRTGNQMGVDRLLSQETSQNLDEALSCRMFRIIGSVP